MAKNNKGKTGKAAKESQPAVNFSNSKRGFNTVVTIFAIIFLILTFIIFILLFKVGASNKSDPINSKFSSLETEYVLKTFLRSPAPDTKQDPVVDLTPDVGEPPTNADLISWTCSEDAQDYKKNYNALKESVNNFFDTTYQKDWNLKIIYSNSEMDDLDFGHGNFFRNWWRKITAFSAQSGDSAFYLSEENKEDIRFQVYGYKEKGFGFQIIPCSDKGYSAVMLKAKGTINYESPDED
jgi:hypothetical protein